MSYIVCIMRIKLTEEQIADFNRSELSRTKKDFDDFKAAISKGVCWVCDKPIDSFNESEPCVHWLLRPPGFRKKHVNAVLDNFTYDRIESFLRWYVNTYQPFRNINDLVEEHEGDKLKALTISHNELEWSFSFSNNCVEGKHGQNGPHYHFQMRIDGRRFYGYSHHVKLSDYELWLLAIELGRVPQLAKSNAVHGMGMQDVISEIAPDKLLASMVATDDYENATFHTSTIIEADPGTTISGDDIADLYEESRRTRVPMHQLVRRLPNIKTKVMIEPGSGVPVPAQRTPVRPGSKKKDAHKS